MVKIHIKKFYELNNLPITQLQSEKKLKISPFEADFGRRPKKSLSNLSTKTSMSKSSYEEVIKKYLAKGPIPADKWDHPERNATETETNKMNTIKDANDHQVNDPRSESGLGLIEVLGTNPRD